MYRMKLLCCVLTILGLLAGTSRAADIATVDKAIEKAKQHLIKTRLADGTWESPRSGGWYMPVGGRTAMAILALRAAGVKASDPWLEKGIEYLRNIKTQEMYLIAARALVFAQLPATKPNLLRLRQDQQLLLQGLSPDGLYSYSIPNGLLLPSVGFNKPPHHATANLGVLGMWACSGAGVEVQASYWETVDASWRRSQRKDGGWGVFVNQEDSTDDPEKRSITSMTAAGIATLLIAQDYRGKEAVKGYINDPRLDEAIKWMTDGFESKLNGGFKGDHAVYYSLFNIERVARAGGYRKLGPLDWYEFGANYLTKKQRPDGAWERMELGSSIPDTAMGLLFLQYGSAPIAITKLEYNKNGAGKNTDKADADNKTADTGHWNRYPRDTAGLTHWLSRSLERELRWQRVTLDLSTQALLDAPILYIAGDEALNFTDAEKLAIKQYLQAGGLILGVADKGSKQFADSFRKLGGELVPDNEFRKLPPEHPLFTGQQAAHSG
jgi:hypothetical protein